MRAALCRSYGGPEVIELADVAAPELGTGQVRVRVNIGAVNFPDVLVVANTYQVSVPTPFILGSEYAGTVVEIDDGAEGLALGDRVFGSTIVGAFAEEIVVAPGSLMRIPDGVDDRTAAAFGVAYRTAYHVLRSVAVLQRGEELVVLGAGGGVGSAAVQLGVLLGATVTAVASAPEKLEAARALGAARLINHRAGDLRQALRDAVGGGADVVVDPVGGDLAEPALRSLQFGGRFVTVGYASGTIPRIPVNLVLLKGCQVLGFQFGDFARHRPEEMARNDRELLELLVAGRAAPLIGATFDLADAGDALRWVAEGKAIGKVVVQVVPGQGVEARANVDVNVRFGSVDSRREVRTGGPADKGRDAVSATAVMKGVRVLEVAEQTFVPAATALLADWGAEIIKIEPTERGDAMRGLAASGVMPMTGDVHPLMEHSNRGKRSLALDLSTAEGVGILYKLAATCDVFLTNKLPRVRKKLKIELEDIRAHNPTIIYVAGTGQGERGPDADKGSYDALSFWYRPGVALGVKPSDMEGYMPGPPGPGFGDSIGAMTIAGGIMGALFHRERTGEATTVDVSLLSSGMWAMGQAYALSLLLNQPWQGPPSNAPRLNPLVRNFTTKDERHLSFCCLQASKYWAELCVLVDRPDAGTDPRFSGHDALMEHTHDAQALMEEAFADHTLSEWRDRLADFTGQWCVVQDTLEAATVDPQIEANGYVQDCETASGSPFKLVAAPIQFGGEPAPVGRSPEFNEHGDAILEEIGIDWDTIVDLKVRSVVG